ncbi:MAG: carbamoyltransferase N-terminal domain-containing protein [Planctomycetota bacterium]|jgi:carbamoyltransferase
MRILGLSAYEQGGAAALVIDGQPVAAASEEHYSRELGDPAFPRRAMRACLRQANLSPGDVDRVVLHTKPLRRFERVLFQELTGFPKTARSFSKQMATWLGDRLWVRGRISQEIGVPLDRVGFCHQGAAQACAALAASGVRDAAVLVSDVHAEWSATCLFQAGTEGLELLDEQHAPHGLAPFLTAVALHLGLPAEDPLEGLSDLARWAPGPWEAEPGLRELLTVDGAEACLRVAPGVLAVGGELAPGPALEALWGPVRQAGGALEFREGERQHARRAAGALALAGEVLAAQARRLLERVGSRRLVLAGELAGAAALLGRPEVAGAADEIQAVPGARHGLAALGAALYAAWYDGEGACVSHFPALGVAPRLGEAVPDADTERPAAVGECLERASAVLESGGLLGWVEGRGALGRQAHAGRAILAPLHDRGLAALSERMLHAEEHRRPVLAVAQAAWSKWLVEPAPAAGLGSERLWTATEALVAACPELVRPDGRVRAQAFDGEPEAPDWTPLLQLAGGALLIAPLAGRGEPVVRTAEDALALFERSELDLLLVEGRAYEPAGA